MMTVRRYGKCKMGRFVCIFCFFLTLWVILFVCFEYSMAFEYSPFAANILDGMKSWKDFIMNVTGERDLFIHIESPGNFPIFFFVLYIVQD